MFTFSKNIQLVLLKQIFIKIYIFLSVLQYYSIAFWS